MNFALVKFNDYGGSLQSDPNGFPIVKTQSGKVLRFPGKPPETSSFDVDNAVKAPKVAWAVQSAVNVVLKIDDQANKLAVNTHLSDIGRRELLEPTRDESLKTMSAIWQDFDKHSTEISALSAARYTVPPLERTDVVGALRDAEIRNALRSLGDDASSVFKNLDEKDVHLMHAILRSPVKFDRFENAARDIWQRYVDEELDPIGTEALKLDRAQVDWGRQALNSINAELKTVLAYDEFTLYAKTKALDAARFFGFTPQQAAPHDVRLRNARR